MQELITALRSAKRIAIVAHIRPDGDAAGSVISLAHVLKQLGAETAAVLKDGVPSAFLFLEGSGDVVRELPSDYDLCVVVDAPDTARTGFPQEIKAYAAAGKLALIDHHIKGDLIKRTDKVLYDENASSTAELITLLIQELNLKLTPAVSTALLTGMYTDTGGFQYGNTTNQTLEFASELMRRGGRLDRIVHQMSRQRSVAGLKLLGIALSRLTLTPDKLGAVTLISLEDLRSSNATAEDATGLVNSLNVLPEVSYCLLLSELEPGVVRGTLRTAEGRTYDVARLAALCGGGGHPRAAGFAISGRLVASESGWRIEPALVS
ncbi:MAG TPA: bifunctional oligoribonuclease/PAP phosphatase NrnA [Verrucomicrobiae bacterium]|nr:bifunctional oligoribonuclease/PAP phosphatase NrnA [Verrucomicrobiae bacterium]